MVSRVLLVGVLLVALWIGRGVSAEAVGPTLVLYESHAFRHVIESNDLLVLVRYKLPKADWQNTTYMDNPTCENAKDLSDDCWVSLKPGVALQTLYAGSGELWSVRNLPRIENGISAVYLPPGHSVPWGDTAVRSCLDGPSNITPKPQVCASLLWHASATVADTPEVIRPVLVQMVLNLEVEAKRPRNTYVNIDKITEQGMIFPREAFPAILFLVPKAFISGVSSAFTDYYPPSGVGALEGQITGQRQTSPFYQNLAIVAREFFGLPVHMVGSLFFFSLALLLGAGLFWATGNPVLGIVVAGMVVLAGSLAGFVPIAGVFAAVAVIITVGVAWVFRRIPM